MPVAMESEGCGQGVVHRRARAQISSWKEAQEQGTSDPLGSPVDRCSPGAGYGRTARFVRTEGENTHLSQSTFATK